MIFPIVFCLRRSKGGLPLVWPVFTVLPNPFPAKTIITITLTLSPVKMRCGSQPNLSSGECTLDFWSSNTWQEFRNWEADLKIQSFTPSGTHYRTLCTWAYSREVERIWDKSLAKYMMALAVRGGITTLNVPQGSGLGSTPLSFLRYHMNVRTYIHILCKSWIAWWWYPIYNTLYYTIYILSCSPVSSPVTTLTAFQF